VALAASMMQQQHCRSSWAPHQGRWSGCDVPQLLLHWNGRLLAGPGHTCAANSACAALQPTVDSG
jgi:hypothetical protein